jgi:hypothetical protein
MWRRGPSQVLWTVQIVCAIAAYPHNPTCSSNGREERGGPDANQPRTVGTLSRVSLGTPAVLARSMPATGARSLDCEGCGKEGYAALQDYRRHAPSAAMKPAGAIIYREQVAAKISLWKRPKPNE